MLPRALGLLFEECSGQQRSLSVSYFEVCHCHTHHAVAYTPCRCTHTAQQVYNKLVLDLLGEGPIMTAAAVAGPAGRHALAQALAAKHALQVMDDRDGRVVVRGLTKHPVANAAEAIAALQVPVRMTEEMLLRGCLSYVALNSGHFIFI